jgi:hypothetical protein
MGEFLFVAVATPGAGNENHAIFLIAPSGMGPSRLRLSHNHREIVITRKVG